MEQLGDYEESVLSQIGSRSRLLVALFPKEHYFISELAQISGVDRGNISKYLPDLEKYGLVDIEKNESTRGKPKKLVMLTETARKILVSYFEIIRKGVGMQSVNIDIVNMITSSITSSHDELIQSDASEELVIISSRYLLPNDEAFFKFLKEMISDPQYSHIRFNLLTVLLNIVKNNKDEDMLRDLLERYEHDLKAIADKMFEDGSDRAMRIYDLALQILVSLSADESRYEYLVKEYVKILRKDLHIINRVRGLIVDHYSLKRDELRWHLFEKYGAEPDTAIRGRYREQMLALR